MNKDFFRFPHTPHLAWLGEGNPRDDKVLSNHEVTELLAAEVVVEEKLDGANLGISLADDGRLRMQNRGQYLHAPFRGQFSRLSSWLALHQELLISHLECGLILFGEWCAARHSVEYVSLPDWFLVFDVYDREAGKFWCSLRRNALAKNLGMKVVPCLFEGRTSTIELKQMLALRNSAFTPGSMEGLVVRCEDRDWLIRRAKLVSPGFTQAIAEHWSSRSIEWNRLAKSHSLPE
jgi:ATP-dependent RNA circularization protein (DNA/RNA ligase family)